MSGAKDVYILSYFSRQKPVHCGLLVPNVSQASSSLAIESANKEVERSEATSTRWVTPSTYSLSQCATIGKYAAIHCPTTAST